MMNEFQATAIFATLFALRCVVPLLLTLAIGYAMNRMVSRWETEEAAQRQTAAQAVVATRAALTLPCWVLRNCDGRRQSCPAYQQPDLACWQARANAEGTLPATCATCPLYSRAPALAP